MKQYILMGIFIINALACADSAPHKQVTVYLGVGPYRRAITYYLYK